MGQLRGIRQLEAFRAGEKLGRKDAIIAKCVDCMNEWRDGSQDCGITTCPLYAFMPYAGKNASEPEPEGEAT